MRAIDEIIALIKNYGFDAVLASNLAEIVQVAADESRREAINECIRAMEKNTRKQSADRCCDNCNCLGMRNGLAELRDLGKETGR